LLDNIRIVPEDEYRDNISKAFSIARNFDEKDTPFIALALKLNIPIWTNDRGILENQGKYKAISTKELLEILSG